MAPGMTALFVPAYSAVRFAPNAKVPENRTTVCASAGCEEIAVIVGVGGMRLTSLTSCAAAFAAETARITPRGGTFAQLNPSGVKRPVEVIWPMAAKLGSTLHVTAVLAVPVTAAEN